MTLLGRQPSQEDQEGASCKDDNAGYCLLSVWLIEHRLRRLATAKMELRRWFPSPCGLSGAQTHHMDQRFVLGGPIALRREDCRTPPTFCFAADIADHAVNGDSKASFVEPL